jgi:hypothetical protein
MLIRTSARVLSRRTIQSARKARSPELTLTNQYSNGAPRDRKSSTLPSSRA